MSYNEADDSTVTESETVYTTAILTEALKCCNTPTKVGV